MSTSLAGALLGLTAGAGLLLVLAHLLRVRRPRLEARMTPYLRDLPRVSAADTRRPPAKGSRALWRLLLGPGVDAAAKRLEALLGGAGTIRRRLARAGSAMTVQEFRVEQVLWGCIGFTGGAAVSISCPGSRERTRSFPGRD